MRFRRLKIQLQTSDGPYGATLDFPDGLVVVSADNSMGKSTCVKAILVALGMEAMLSTNQSDLPLPPAIKSRLDSNTGEHDVIESEIFLEIENKAGNRIVVQRTVKGERDKNLITIHEGAVLTSPEISVRKRDLFVSRAGAATREHGFHHYLARFLDWSLPTVQTYDGNENPLYLQCIFPYFMVEQTRGWSTLQPPLPSHFRIKDAHKRATEFLLNLEANQIALQRQEILFEKGRIESEWLGRIGRANDLAERAGGTIEGLSERPVASWPPTIAPSLMVPSDTTWISINQRISNRLAQLELLVEQEIPRVQEITTTAKAELTETETKLREKQTLHSRLLDSLQMEEQEFLRITERLTAIDEDIQKNKDVRTLRQLGSRQSSAVENGACPVCHQSIHDSLIPLGAEQAVMSLDDNILFLQEQKRTYEAVLTNARRVVESRKLQINAVREELTSLRDRVRALRQTLVSDGRLPSIAAIQSRMELENSSRKDQDFLEQFTRLIDGFGELSQSWLRVKSQLERLPADDVTESDKRKLSALTLLLRDQLRQYGFGSFAVEQINISLDTYRPEHEGFDLQTSISASDLIRTIWANLNGLLEISRTQTTSHPGCILFDEPRQQSTRDVSFKELLKRASSSGQFGQQVIFFTSENRERLRTHLLEVPHTLQQIEGRVVKKIEQP